MDDRVREIANFIYENDRLFKFLGAEILECADGYAKLRMRVEDRHLNAVGVCQGGVIFTLADLAFAVASNVGGKLVLAANCNIYYMKTAEAGDVLIAEAKRQGKGSKLSHYIIDVFKEDSKEKVALFTGLGYFLGKEFITG